MKTRLKAIVAFVLAGILALCFAVIVGGAGHMRNRAATVEPNPNEADAPEGEGNAFPAVDWGYWKSVNPDVIGWVTVPGTQVDYPIVQAPEDAPLFYLTHDVYGNWNFAGCPYLDSSCNDGLLANRNAVVFGHNLGFGDESMFASFANYTDKSYAETHPLIYVQTPTDKAVLSVRASNCISGWEATKRVKFSDFHDFASWYEAQYERSEMKLIEGTPERITTFVTCSYNRWSNERTIVYCSASES